MSDKSFRRPAESAEISEFRGNGRTIERECAPAPAGEDARYRAGFNAGVKAAANWHMEAAAEWETADISDADRLKAREYAKQHRADAARIRTLKLPENANG